MSAHLHPRSFVAALRALVVAAVLLGVGVLLTLTAVRAARSAHDVSDAVRAVVTGLGALVALRSGAWSTVASLVCAAQGTGRTARRAETALRTHAPVLARRLLVGATGASLALAPLPALAVTGSPDAAVVAASVGAGADTFAWPAAGGMAADALAWPAATTTGTADALAWPATADDDRPAPAAPGRTDPDRPGPARPGPTGHRVVVRPGDTLWGLASAALPAATDADLVAAWPEIHRLNRGAVGDDPDLLRPGTVLHVPAAADDGRTFRTTDRTPRETR